MGSKDASHHKLGSGGRIRRGRGAVLLYILHDIAILTDEGRPVYIQGE